MAVTQASRCVLEIEGLCLLSFLTVAVSLAPVENDNVPSRNKKKIVNININIYKYIHKLETL